MKHCEQCKHFGEEISADPWRRHHCKLHGIKLYNESRGCYWHDQDAKVTGNVSSEGMMDYEYVQIWKGKNYSRVAYYIAEYSGRWFIGADVNLQEWGWGSKPNIHGKSHATKEAAVEYFLQMCLRDARQTRNEEEIAIFEKALNNNQQLTLF